MPFIALAASLVLSLAAPALPQSCGDVGCFVRKSPRTVEEAIAALREQAASQEASGDSDGAFLQQAAARRASCARRKGRGDREGAGGARWADRCGVVG